MRIHNAQCFLLTVEPPLKLTFALKSIPFSPNEWVTIWRFRPFFFGITQRQFWLKFFNILMIHFNILACRNDSTLVMLFNFLPLMHNLALIRRSVWGGNFTWDSPGVVFASSKVFLVCKELIFYHFYNCMLPFRTVVISLSFLVLPHILFLRVLKRSNCQIFVLIQIVSARRINYGRLLFEV